MIFSRIDIVPFSLLLSFWFCLCILSFAWSVYMLGRNIKERKYLKYIQSVKNSMHEQVWSVKMNNSNRKIVKNKFLLVISSIEWFGMFILIFFLFYDNRHYTVNKYRHVPLGINAIHGFNDIQSTSIQDRVFSTFAIILLEIVPLVLMKILTQYQCQQYTFYSDNSFSFRRKFRIPSAMLIFLFVICLISELILFELFIFILYFACEFVCFTKATNRLCRLLYKRYFDARTHEYQPIPIVQYYRWAYLEFRVCSCILVASIFFRILSLILFLMFSLFGAVLLPPNDSIPSVFMNSWTMDYSFLQNYPQQLKVFESVCNSILLICMCIAWGLLVLPYSLVSLKFCLHGVRARYKSSKDYPNHKLIQQMITNNYLLN